MAKMGDETKKERLYTGTKQISESDMLVKLTVGTDTVYHKQPIGKIEDDKLDRKMIIIKANAGKIPTITAKAIKEDKSAIIAAEIAKAAAGTKP